MSKTENLTYERASEILRYKPETGVLERKLRSGRWRACGDRPTHSAGYGQVGVDGKMYRTHRLIWLLVHGEWPEFIDHIDRNRINNRIENLRIVTLAENQHNQGLRKNNTTGYPGVVFHKQRNKYQAHIRINGKRTSLGYYPTAEEAHVAFMLGKIEYHPTSPTAQEYLRELTLAG